LARHTWARDERRDICDLFDRIGPDAPTLCTGWTTRDLAVHIVVREGHALSQRGKPGTRWGAWGQRVWSDTAALPWPELIAAVRNGPPRWSAFAIPGADALLNTAELFVHHEDVRRAQPDWQPRELAVGFSDVLWRTVAGRFSGILLNRFPLPVILRRQDAAGGEKVARKGSPRATMSGPAQEILLYVFGRKEHALVTIDGDDDALARLAAADLSM
jgi:uncharacterized protein (TIGR03085 family)